MEWFLKCRGRSAWHRPFPHTDLQASIDTGRGRQDPQNLDRLEEKAQRLRWDLEVDQTAEFLGCDSSGSTG